jgi:DNA-binding FadR family transcriptional regulator
MMPAPNTTRNTAARIERSLTTAVLRGEYGTGARLPTVRELARSYDVNPATVQRALMGLERSGLVTARQGSGIVVNDPELAGDVSLMPAWLEALADQPERAAAMLEDFLEVRRILASRLIVRHRARLMQRVEVLAEAAARVAAAVDQGLDALRDADLAFARALLRETGNTVAIAVFNTAARLLEEVPAVAQAMYETPADNARSMGRVLEVLLSEHDDRALAAEVESAIAEVDQRTVSRFEALLKEAAL